MSDESINVVSGGYVVCPFCGAKLLRLEGKCPACGAIVPAGTSLIVPAKRPRRGNPIRRLLRVLGHGDS